MPRFGKALKGSAGAAASSDPNQQLLDRIQREAELEQRKQYATAAKRRLKGDLQRERGYSQTNKLKIQNNWRKIMRLAKVESLRKDIEVISQNHERDVDRKDAIVQMLDRDLEESEEQYQMALRSHLQNIDTLIDLQDARLLALENDFESDLRTLEDEFNAEREEIEKQHATEKTELLDIMAAVEADERERETETRHAHEQIREEIRNRNTEEINVLRITLESQIEELERHFESAHLNYLQNTDQRTQDFKYLTTQDQTLSKDIEIKLLKIERLKQSLAHWRSKISQNNRECTQRNTALKSEKDAIATHFQELKSRMNKFRVTESRRLLELTQNTRTARSQMNDNLKLARRIISLAELARNLETKREQVMPFSSNRNDTEIGEQINETPEQLRAAEELTELMTACTPSAGKRLNDVVETEGKEGERNSAQSFGSTSNGNSIPEWEYLQIFFKRFNEVNLDKLTVERERDRLRRENSELQGILKQYIEGISVNEEVLSRPNPLLVVNGRSNMRRPPVRHAAPAVLDGNLMVNTGRIGNTGGTMFQ
jgi:dynein regulatory complex subunit 2